MSDIKDAPDPPDPMETAGYQTGTNIGTSIANAKFGYVGTDTPYGQTKLKKTGTVKYKDPYTGEKYKIPKYKEKVILTPEGKEQFALQQGTQTNLLNLGNQLSTQMGDYMSKPFSLGGFDFGADLGMSPYQAGTSLEGDVYSGDPLKLGNEATEARLFELGSKRLDPKFTQDQATLQSSLMSRGIREGTVAWDAAMRNFNEGKNDAYNNLLLTGRGQAAAETQAEWDAGLRGQGQTFGQQVAARQLGMSEQAQGYTQSLADRQRLLAERQQQTGEAFAERSQPINEIAALLGTGGQVNVPQLTGYSTTQIPITDTAGLINTNWDQQFQEWQAESQATQGLMGGMFGMAGNIFASDRRIKDNVAPVGKTETGLPIYEFTIGDGPTQTGVLAQDVEDVNPDAVMETPSGIKAVDYAAAVGAGDGTYTVEKGDNLTKIGQRFGVGVPDIVGANPQVTNPDRIMPGDTLTIPGLAAPGPEAIPYDPMASAFLPPETGGGVPAVMEALQSQAAGQPVEPAPAMPPSDFPARPEFPGTLPAAPRAGDMSAAMGNAPPPDFTPASQPISTDPSFGVGYRVERDAARMAEQQDARMSRFADGMESERLANEIGFTRREMEPFQPPYRGPPAPAGAGMDAMRFDDAAGPRGGAQQIMGLGDMNGIGFPEMQPEPRVGTVQGGSTGGEFFSPPPNVTEAPDPNAMRFADTFDTPAGRTEIMDLLAAFQNRNMLPMGGMMPPMRAGIGLGGF